MRQKIGVHIERKAIVVFEKQQITTQVHDQKGAQKQAR
jgi:hypothetical protein